ncbi:MAG: MogA/MoaB family molybdenum cofactor biosynthesis protein [Acidobacteria bacterium]|nr:MogA/MoaB family molybdenum cofactor biosynthesis protein [Acidobacteriota bacterium]MBI3473668.1 MogA/MoaB family molybdenum cofactor biosynthesis protein [Candidatus Solibacter usitatus]
MRDRHTPQAAVITVSDSVHAGTRADRSGPAVRERLEQLGWEVSVLEVLPDESPQIAARLALLADAGRLSAIFTTGGTGIASRDITPEATRSILDREILGLSELMRAKGREQTPLAVLSRAVAGTRGSVLIVNLPGSPRGAVESLNAIVDLVPHMLDLLRGDTEHAVTGAERGVRS